MEEFIVQISYKVRVKAKDVYDAKHAVEEMNLPENCVEGSFQIEGVDGYKMTQIG